jgi:hypothetical protein
MEQSVLLEIGSTDGPGALTMISDFFVDPEGGRIYVAQPMDGELRIYNALGELLQTFGRRGFGPGEFQRLAALGKRQGQIWLYDAGLQRITYLDSAASIVQEHRITFPMAGSPRPAGSAILFVPGITPGGSPLSLPIRVPILAIESAGTIRDTIATMVFRRPPGLPIQRSRGVMNVTQPLQDHTLLAVSPKGEWLTLVDAPIPSSEMATITVVAVDLDGDTLWRRSLEQPSTVLPSDFLEPYFMAMRKAMSSRVSDVDELVKHVNDQIALPRYLPAVDRALVSHDGSVWLRVSAPKQAAQSEWLVLNLDDPVRFVRVPSFFSLRYVFADTVWGTYTDSLGVQTIQKRLLHNAAGGAPLHTR